MNVTLNFLFQQSKTEYHYNKIKYFKSLVPQLRQENMVEAFVSSYDNLKLQHFDAFLY